MSNERDWDRFFKLVDEFEADLEENSAAMENEPVLRRLKFSLRKIAGYDPYIAEKASAIEEYLKIFFSSRRHKQYPGGADAVYSKIVHDLLGRIKQQARLLQRGDGQDANEVEP